MGYYIETDFTHGKAEAIAEKYDGIVYPTPPDYDAIDSRGDGIIVVINNGLFEAAGFAYDKQEFLAFTQPDDLRPKKFVIMDRATAEIASGYKR